jgi:hypothetical protein
MYFNFRLRKSELTQYPPREIAKLTELCRPVHEHIPRPSTPPSPAKNCVLVMGSTLKSSCVSHRAVVYIDTKFRYSLLTFISCLENGRMFLLNVETHLPNYTVLHP